MKLSRKEIYQLKQDGDVTHQEFLRLMTAKREESSPQAEEEEVEDPTSQAINRLTNVVEQLGAGKHEEHKPTPFPAQPPRDYFRVVDRHRHSSRGA